jgi:hypothetical protein
MCPKTRQIRTMVKKIPPSFCRMEPFIQNQSNSLRAQKKKKINQTWKRKGHEVDCEWQAVFFFLDSVMAQPLCKSYKRRAGQDVITTFIILLTYALCTYCLLRARHCVQSRKQSIRHRSCAQEALSDRR